jgi:hypothetical protein
MKGVSERPLIRVAAQNNAEWCDAFCRTHGIVGHFRAGCWFSPVRTPRYYPDAVTLLPEITIEQVLSGIDTSEGCSVKDSFAGLDLAVAGFRPLFSAHWLAREPARPRIRSARRWSILTTAEQLGEWEAAWAASPEGAGFFKPSLLKDETIGVLAGYEGDRIVAGAIANRSSTVIGLSNVFDVAGDLESGWVAAAAIAASLWGQMTTVGYDSGDSLEAAHAGGFKSIGELVVWLNADSSPSQPREECAAGRVWRSEDGGGAYFLERLPRPVRIPFAYCDNVSCPRFCPRIGESNLTLPTPEWLR